MGTTCGCAAGETRIKGETMDHGHWHVHADGSAHAHAAAAVDEGGALHYGHGAAGAHVRCVNPALPVIRVSATSGEGFGEWTVWLENGLAAQRAQAGNGRRAPAPHRGARSAAGRQRALRPA